MSEAEEKPQGATTLDELLEHWNIVAPHLDALAHRSRLDLDSSGDLARARKVIGGFLQDCQDMAAMQGKQDARGPEEREVLEEAARILREKARAAGVTLRMIDGEPGPDEPEPSEKAAAENAGAAEDRPADNPEAAAPEVGDDRAAR